MAFERKHPGIAGGSAESYHCAEPRQLLRAVWDVLGNSDGPFGDVAGLWSRRFLSLRRAVPALASDGKAAGSTGGSGHNIEPVLVWMLARLRSCSRAARIFSSSRYEPCQLSPV